MQRCHTQTRNKLSTVKQRFKQPLDVDDDLLGDRAIRFDGNIEILAEEDGGDDPYNHTGRFEHNIR